MIKPKKKSWGEMLNDFSFGGMLLVVYFSTTLFLVYYLEKVKNINPKLYWIVGIVSCFWVLCLAINIITAGILNDGKKKTKER